jgi:hypothetical protein
VASIQFSRQKRLRPEPMLRSAAPACMLPRPSRSLGRHFAFPIHEQSTVHTSRILPVFSARFNLLNPFLIRFLFRPVLERAEMGAYGQEQGLSRLESLHSLVCLLFCCLQPLSSLVMDRASLTPFTRKGLVTPLFMPPPLLTSHPLHR